jgi:diacylglycerol kinase family enzyme
MVLAQGPAEITAEDRNLSITLVTPEHRLGVLRSAAHLFFSALRQRSVEDEAVQFCKAKSVKVTADPPQTVFVDGEPFGKTPITVANYPRSLNVLTPRETG